MRPMTLRIFLATTMVVPMTALAQLPGPPAADPCVLVSRADVEQIVGPLKSAPKTYVIERAKNCSYELVNQADELDVWIYPATGLDRARNSHKDFTPLTDLGEPGFYGRRPDLGWLEIYTRKGGVTLGVMLRAPGDLEKAKALTRKALAKM
jgi:hypothetical protein